MKGYVTSYVGLFGTRPDASPGVASIEIPLIQRDYAQGRQDDQAREIRADFLEVLLNAVEGGEPLGLDFVYGRIEATTFYPLDGQQRLTTLFLLHWYLASVAGRLDADAAWTRFSYATRPSARLFCQRLATNPLPCDASTPSIWITDQAWYLHVWHNDPTIQAMLVMIDSIHKQLMHRDPAFDPQVMWNRLTNTESPAVSFYLLPLDDMASDEDLYIKMNSRGKPLTKFESFKARFEQDIRHSDRADEFAHKIDGRWSDLLWPYHGGDHLVDDEFYNYLSFITELCELREGKIEHGRLGLRAPDVFGEANPRAGDHLDFLFGAFDNWQNTEHITATFNDALSTALPGQDHYNWQKVVPFGVIGTDLFQRCLHRGPVDMTSQQRLLLYAFLLHVVEGTEDFPRRLRVLRNLIAASENELRGSNMPSLVEGVEQIIVNGNLNAVTRFSGNQVADERRKQEFLVANPELAPTLFRLEDHPILRGTLNAFELDNETFAQRARAFETAFADRRQWLHLTGALLALGDYQRQRPNSGSWQFGSADNEAVWRDLLTGTTYQGLQSIRAVLGRLLDGLASSASDPGGYFKHVISAWLAAREDSKTFDWRYYLVKYPSMRTGTTGIYYGVNGRLSYSMCMLRTTRLNGYYRDPILLQVWHSSGVGERVKDPWFTGYETIPRWMRLERSGVGMRSIDDGFALDIPDDGAFRASLATILDQHGAVHTADGAVLLRIPQQQDATGLVDTTDRIVAGAAFLRDLGQAGL